MEVIQVTDRAQVFSLKALNGRTLGIPTIRGTASPKAKELRQKLIIETAKLDEALATGRKMVTKGELQHEEFHSWRNIGAANLKPLISEALAQTAKDRAATAAKRDAILQVPHSTDAGTVIIDNEIRQAFRTMPEKQKATALAEIGKGKHARVLIALARSPIPGEPIGESARGIYRAQQQEQQSDALAALDREDEGAMEVETAISGIQRVI